MRKRTRKARLKASLVMKNGACLKVDLQPAAHEKAADVRGGLGVRLLSVKISGIAAHGEVSETEPFSECSRIELQLASIDGQVQDGGRNLRIRSFRSHTIDQRSAR